MWPTSKQYSIGLRSFPWTGSRPTNMLQPSAASMVLQNSGSFKKTGSGAPSAQPEYTQQNAGASMEPSIDGMSLQMLISMLREDDFE